MPILASANRLEFLWNRLISSGEIPPELAGEADYILFSSLPRLNLVRGETVVPPEELARLIQRHHYLIALADPLMEQTRFLLQPTTHMALSTPEGIVISSSDPLCLGRSSGPEVQNNLHGPYGDLIRQGVAVNAEFDEGSQMGTVSLLDKNKEIEGHFHIRGEGTHITREEWCLFYLTSQMLQNALNQYEYSREYAGAFIASLDEPCLVLDAQCCCENVNETMARILQSGKSRPAAMYEYSFLLHDRPLVDSNAILAIQTPEQIQIRSTEMALNITLEKSLILNTRYGDRLILMFDKQLPGTRSVRKTGPETGVHPAFATVSGRSESMLRIKRMATMAAPYESTILIEGESGVGKEVLAKAIHQASGRKGPFIAVNCGGIPAELLNSEVFGYEEGAFSGARRGGKPGQFEAAAGGTLFLDEIGEMPMEMQVALLRFLQEKAITRVGGRFPLKLDVRIICATNRDLSQAIEAGIFREDLYYRINLINIVIPPLRERKEDILSTAVAFLQILNNRYHGQARPEFSPQEKRLLIAYDWPGNMRELGNLIERAFIMKQGEQLDLAAAFAMNRRAAASVVPLPVGGKSLKEIQREAILLALDENRNITSAAETLGISRQALYRRLKDFHIRMDAIGIGEDCDGDR